MEDTLFINYATTKQVMYLDQNGVVTTISFAQLLDSLGVEPAGSQWSIQYNDSGDFSGSNNLLYDGDLGVFYITDTNMDTIFSVNTQTREVRSRGTFSLNQPDSTIAIIDGNGNVLGDSVSLGWKGNGIVLLNAQNAATSVGAMVITSTTSAAGRIASSVTNNAAAQAPTYQFFRARGTLTARLVPISGTELGTLAFGGWDGTQWVSTSTGISGISGGTWTSTSFPGFIRIRTVDANSNAFATIFTQKGGLSIKGQNSDTSADFTINGTMLTGSENVSLARWLHTWNTSASPTAFFMNITNTSSGASSLLADWRTNNVSVFSVSPVGQLTTASNITSGDNFIAASGGSFTWGGSKSRITSNANGNITLSNNGITGFGILYFGGTTSAFPAMQRQNNVIRFLVSDTSAYAGVQTGQLSVNSAPNASAALTVTSTTQGFLPPVMTATQGSAIASPATGLLIYVTDTNGTFTSTGWWGFNGATWEKLNN